jgi:hypothetical protein
MGWSAMVRRPGRLAGIGVNRGQHDAARRTFGSDLEAKLVVRRESRKSEVEPGAGRKASTMPLSAPIIKARAVMMTLRKNGLAKVRYPRDSPDSCGVKRHWPPTPAVQIVAAIECGQRNKAARSRRVAARRPGNVRKKYAPLDRTRTTSSA